MIPQATFDPYILQQASCRASALVAKARFCRDDWEDVRQELVLDCLERMPWFDPCRGDWRAFVRGVIRNHSGILSARESQRIRFEDLAAVDGETDADGDQEGGFLHAPPEPASDDPTTALTLSVDVHLVIASLPDNLRALALDLMQMTVAETAAKRGRSKQWIYHLMKRLRQAFVRAGVTPKSVRCRGGLQ